MILESHGEEQAAELDAADYRCLRAVAAAEGDPQAAWNRILAAYLDGDISLGRFARLLGVRRFELTARLGLPLHQGSATPAETRQERARLDA